MSGVDTSQRQPQPGQLLRADTFLYRRFERQAAQSPAAIAVSCGDESITYAALNRRANEIAHELIALGIGAESLVGLCAHPSVELLVGMLAVMKAGGAYMPLEPAWPAGRVSSILEESACQIVLTTAGIPAAHAQVLERSASRVMVVQAGDHSNAERADAIENPAVATQPDELCYVMYTSGSTGQPNGVMVSHANVAMLFESMQATLGFSPADSWSAMHSFAFGFSVWEVWGPLTTGARLIVIPEAMRSDPVAWCEHIATERVSVLSVTPSGFRQLLLADCLSAQQALPDLRLVVFSGEAVSAADIEAWYAATDSQARLVNTYALTETAGRMTLLEYQRHESVSPTSIGQAVPDARILLLDPDDGRQLATGETGELYLGGQMVARGYLHNPELTAQRFVELETDEGMQRFYRSGDLARLTAAGELEFVGRQDSQVKLRGHRIELGAIEHALRQHPAIADVAVTVQDAGAVQQLTAFVVPAGQDVVRTGVSDVEFWPSLGEYQIYDDLLYDFMSADEVRVASYNQAFLKQARGKVVLDIGTGKDAVLARLCAAAGARKVYAVEVLPDAAASARKLIAELGLADRIEVICGDMQTISLPDEIELCTQGIIGNIGSSDGIVKIWNDARPLFAPTCVAVPERCTTLIAPAELPAAARTPAFTPLAQDYAQAIFNQSGGPFDVRLCVRNFPDTGLLAQPAVFEDLNFDVELTADYSGAAAFTVARGGKFDGFLLWTRINTHAEESVDFFEHQQAWLPVWMPICDKPLDVAAGTVIQASWTCSTPAGDIFPDYQLSAELRGTDGQLIKLSYTTRHHETALNQTALHRSILGNMRAPAAAESVPDYSAWLAGQLPAYMLPGRWVQLEQLPLNTSGKLDRELLRTTAGGPTNPVLSLPESELEQDIAAIWCAVLDCDALDLDADFFDSGGDSILAVRLTTEVQRYLDDTVFLAALFDAPTIRTYAAWLLQHHADAVARRHGVASKAEPTMAAVASATAPLSFAQQSLWFLQQLYPQHTGANEQFLIRINGAPDPSRLAAAWKSLLTRHDVFRSSIAVVNALPQLQVHSLEELGASAGMPLHDLSGMNRSAALERLHAAAAVSIVEPFELASPPLLRACLYRLPEQETVLLITAHHIIADGLCVPLIRDELAAAYAGAETPRPEWQFSDFARWQHDSLDEQWLTEELAWWAKELDGHSGQPASGNEYLGNAAAGGRELRVPFVLDAASADKLRALAKHEGATLFMLLLAAWRSWLTRCFNEQDLLIGSPATLRRDERTQNMLGCLVNNVVYRNPVQSGQGFRDLLAQERSHALEVYDHSAVPFEKIVETLAPERIFGRHPLFQIMFMFDDRSTPVVEADGLKFSFDVPTVDRASYWDIELSVSEHGAGEALTGFMGIRADVFDAAALSCWPAGLSAMLQAVAADPDVRLDSLPLMNADQLSRSLLDWNATDMPFPDESLHELFAQQAERNAEQIAVADGVHTLSYGELNALADAYAQGLGAQEVGPGAIVGLSLPRSATAVACLLAILKRGAIWLPLDPGYPQARLQAMLADANPQLLICADKREIYAGEQCVTPAELRVASALKDSSAVSVASADPAWLLYTSGSTGVPKGVIGQHATAVSRCRWMWQQFAFSQTDIFAQRTSLNFVDSIWEIFGALLHGARVEILPVELAADPAGMLDWLGKTRVTHLVVVPSLLHGLLEAAANGPELSSLHTLISSGEALPAELAMRAQQVWPACRLLNTYGTTETWDGSYHEVTAADQQLAAVPIGRPVANARLYIVDNTMQPLPPGVTGELCVGGLAVGEGYLNQPEISAEKFQPDPFSDVVNARLYRTGDHARYRADGTVELLGRIDRQFKLRGLRAEPGDIEAQVLSYSDVSSCAVVLRSAPERSDWLCLYLVWREQGGAAEGSREDLRRYLQTRLPRALVPADICVLDELPLLPNGKLDRAALPHDTDGVAAGIAYVEPRNETEVRLAQIWAAALQLERVGVHDDFFALRGHSLLATRVIARICDELGVDLPLQCLFESPTVAGLAQQVDTLRWAIEPGAVAPGAEREVVRI